MKHTLETYQLFFGSLANPGRLQIISTLREGPKNVGEISKDTALEQTMVSHNLKRLERCGMVFATKKGKFRYYALNEQTIRPLLELIDEHMSQYCVHLISKSHSKSNNHHEHHEHHDHHVHDRRKS